MIKRAWKVVGSVAAATLVGFGCAAGSAVADAARSVSDPSSLGGVALFDAVGAPLTSGTDSADWARFVVAGNSDGGKSGAPVTLSAAVVDSDQPPAAWPVTVLTGGPGATPRAATPAGLPAALLPLAGSVLDAGGSDLADALPTDTSGAADDSPVVLQLRLSYSTSADADYWSAYLDVDRETGRWHLAPVHVDASAPTLSAPQVSYEDNGVVAVTDTVDAANGTRPVGWVELFDRSVDRGTAAYDPATGNVTAKVLPDGDQFSYHFVFTPADTADYSTAESPVTGCACGASEDPTVDPTSTPTMTTTSGTPGTAKPTEVVVTVTPPLNAAAFGSTEIAVSVLPEAVSGTVELRAGSGFSASVPVVDGHASVSTNSFGAGSHVISATFTPSDTGYAASAATSAPFTLIASGHPGQSDGVSATVSPGPLTITTPYGPGHALELGSLALAPDGSRLTATAHVGTTADAAHRGITITDTRAGDPGWSASLLASDLTDGTDVLSAQNLGFVDVRPIPVRGYGGGGLGTVARPVITHDIRPSGLVQAPGSRGTAGLARTPKIFASAKHGRGSVYIIGDLQLEAPTSALSGEYTATLTFTVS